MCVVGSKSGYIDVISGVGQGTIFGPLLFIIFFNDSDSKIGDVLDLNFADDKKIFAIIKTEDDALRLKLAINEFMTWCKDNDLSINRSKSKVITFTLKRNSITYPYSMNEKIITRVHEIRDLGVIMDVKLSFSKHIEFITKKENIAAQFVMRQSAYFGKDIIRILYMALVRSNLELACSVWSPHHTVYKNTLESIQKQFLIRFNGDNIDRVDNNYLLRPYSERCGEIKLQSLIRRRINASVLFIHAIIVGKIKSPFLREHMDLNTGLRTLRNLEFIRLRYCRTEHSTWSKRSGR